MSTSVLSQFPQHFDYHTMIYSETASRHLIDNSPGDRELKNLIRVAWFLETLRFKLILMDEATGPLIVSSGYRCQKLNKKVGGSSTSAHMKGLAADIKVQGMSAYTLARFINENMVEVGWDQLIHEFGSWVHVGLSEDMQRMQVMTAMKKKNAVGALKTVYIPGVVATLS